ncbi:MAG TPA: phenylalanine--tRNA ligase subunit beta [Clostridiales bacterium]|nr:phenylalanine--tRNA ligase subunit beta [Clostridiales bacterium]
MKVPMNWLREYVDIPLSDNEYQDRMIMTGTALEGYIYPGQDLQNVVVGRVLSCRKHENSDHLHVCMVDAGQGEPLQVVCGAPNVKEGLLVPVALIGAKLPGGHTIKKGKLRGVESYGMLCSATELDIPQELYPSVGDEGLLVFNEEYELGTDIRDIFGLNDAVADFEILANRPDCLSMWGIARESAAVLNQTFRMPDTSFTEHDPHIDGLARVTVLEPELCPRYTSRIVHNVRIGPSPQWLRYYLHAAGMRSINNIVDITNYVMLETGHPMHAFDLEQVRGRHIIVRKAKACETLTTLDGKKHTMTGDELMICDEQGPTGFAGIMGGLESEITEKTHTILFECASFDRTSIRLTARKHGIRTESSSRFERGVAPATTLTALERACHLVQELNAGDIGTGCIDVYPVPVHNKEICASIQGISQLAGVPMQGEEMVTLLQRLQFDAHYEGDTLWATPPKYRQDVETQADLCEEVLRLGGYDRIPSTLLRGETTPGRESNARRLQRKLGQILNGLGLDEITTYSFTSQKQLAMLGFEQDDPRLQPLTIRNPLGDDTSVMRTTLAADMLRVLSTNMNRGNAQAQLYEFGTLFDASSRTEEGLIHELPALSVGGYGEGLDFYWLRDVVRTLLSHLGIEADIEAGGEPYHHPGRSARLTVNGQLLAVLGEVHPKAAQRFALPERAYVGEIYLNAVTANAVRLEAVEDLPRTPAVTRDVALVLPEKQELMPVYQEIRKAGGALIEDLKLFDVYRSAHLGEGLKSAAFSLVLRARDRTLSEDEINAAMDKVITACKTRFGAQLRS